MSDGLAMAEGVATGVSEGRAFARAALAGNPSDMYGGAVLGMTIPDLRVEVRLGSGDEWVGGGPEADAGEDAREVLAPNLVDATLSRFIREFPGQAGAEGLGAQVAVRTNIPRSVGLGGSSAIVIALLRALCGECSVEVGLDELAELALSIERDDLGIAAGLQDRVTQAYEGVVFMDFAAGNYKRVDGGRLPPLLIGWRAGASAPSGQVHGGLRARWEAGETLVRESISELAALGREARDAVVSGDHRLLRHCVDASYDARARMLTLDPLHVEMVENARAAGAAANYTGSGGAIVCVCRDATHRREVAKRLGGAGCSTMALDPIG